jgi:hypothetical protein
MFDALFRIVALVRKELLAILKDPRSRIALIAPPIVQCLIFGYAASYDLNNVSASRARETHKKKERVTPFHHLSGDSHINCSLRARPITASSQPRRLRNIHDAASNVIALIIARGHSSGTSEPSPASPDR